MLAEDEQWAKLRMIVEIADEVWGNSNETHQAAVPRRPCRQPAAARRPEGGARASAPRARSRPRELKAIEDREIERVIKKQEEVGLQAITDGEFRRSWWHLDFLWGLDGVEKHVMERGIAFAGVQHAQRGRRRSPASSACPADPMVEHFKFVAGAHQAHAEDHHPGAVGDLRPPDADADRQDGLSGASTSSSPISARPTRRRCAASPTPAAAICSSTRCSSPCCAIRSTASR